MPRLQPKAVLRRTRTGTAASRFQRIPPTSSHSSNHSGFWMHARRPSICVAALRVVSLASATASPVQVAEPSHSPPPLPIPQVCVCQQRLRATKDCSSASDPPLVCTLQVIIMLQARSERQAAGAGSLWVPGMSPGLMDAGSARAQEIARRREEMMGMLHDLPESEYELSLTDLVEKSGNGEAATEGKEPGTATRSASGRLAGQHVQQQTAAGKPERRGSARRRDGGNGSSFRSSSDGVLLNFYMPRSLTRSFTAPRPSRTPSISGGRTPSVASGCNKRERDADVGSAVKCWPLLWDRPWRKSSRPDPPAPPNDNVRAAILKAAKHSASPAKV